MPDQRARNEKSRGLRQYGWRKIKAGEAVGRRSGAAAYCRETILFREGKYWPEAADGGKISDEEYRQIHAEIIKRDAWIIDGYGSVVSGWERFALADTLVYIDLPLLTHYRWVTSRLIKGLFRNPPGRPENSPVLASTWDSYRVVWRCHRGLTPQYRRLAALATSAKRVHHLKSASEIEAFLQAVKQEYRRT